MKIIQAIKDFCGPPKAPADARFIYWKASDRDWRWHLKAANHEILAHGEGYVSRAGVLRGIAAVQRAAVFADIVPRD